MKILQLDIKNFRSFKGDRPALSFVDEGTGQARPLTVLVGSNGCGKTTVFEVIEALLRTVVQPILGPSMARPKSDVIGRTLSEHGFAQLVLEPGPGMPKALLPSLCIVLGSRDQAPAKLARSPNRFNFGDGNLYQDNISANLAPFAIDQRIRALTDGLIHFPHNRWISHAQRGGIEPPPAERPWIYHFEPQTAWQGSLTQLWVWQNYLDLEEGQAGRKNLAPFVEVVEEILGRGQRVVIRQGRVFIQRPHLGDEIGPDELPAGEQQILTLFGELARQLRPGAVVLIDEVENSLHPALQRAVLFHLRRLSARYDLQIILATHSMEIVSAVSPHEILNLDDMVIQERQRPAEEPAG